MAFLVGGANSGDAEPYSISNSCRFNQVDSPKLSWTPASDANRQIMTWSFWLKRSTIINDVNGSYQFIMGLDDEGVGYNPVIRLNNDAPGDTIRVSFLSGMGLTTDRSYRDVSAWYHVVLAFDSTQAVAANRIKIYTNGVQETTLSASAYGSQNDIAMWGKAGRSFDIGWMDISSEWATAKFLDGYLADFYYINEQQLTPTDFGEFDEDSGIWKPKKYTGSYNSYSWFLEFKQTGTDADASGIGADTSGQDNHFTSTNLAATDITTDTPTNNFATMKIHGAAAVSGAVLAEGNLKCTTGTSGSGRDLGRIFISDILMSSGKWYWEAKVADTGAQMGLSAYQGSRLGNTTNNTRFLVLNNAGTVADKADSSESSDTYMAATSADDIVQFALDMDADPKVMYFGNGGNWGDGSGNTDESSPSSGIHISGGAHDILTDTTDNEGFIGFSFHSGGGGTTATAEINFGNPSFAISSGNADANGYGNFEYAVPSGYYALCTKNLAEYG